MLFTKKVVKESVFKKGVEISKPMSDNEIVPSY